MLENPVQHPLSKRARRYVIVHLGARLVIGEIEVRGHVIRIAQIQANPPCPTYAPGKRNGNADRRPVRLGKCGFR